MSTSSATSLLAEAARRRERALALRKMVLQQTDTPCLDDRTFEHVARELACALAMEADGHRLLAEESGGAAAPPEVASTAHEDGDSAKPLAVAAAVTAWALPLGMVTLGSAIAAAPHIGVDMTSPLGLPSARGNVRASLRRDSAGLFRILLREDGRGVYVFGLEESDAGDDRSLLVEGDYLVSIDGVPVAAGGGGPAGEERRGALGLDEAKARIRDAPTSVSLEVSREVSSMHPMHVCTCASSHVYGMCMACTRSPAR